MKKFFIALIVLVLVLMTGFTFVYVNRHVLIKKYPEQIKPFEGILTRVEILLGQTKEEERKKEREKEDAIIREENLSRLEVEYDGKKVYVKDGKLYYNLDILDEKIPSDKNVLSIVNEWLYYIDEFGPVRYNLEEKIKQQLYYDLYDYFIVGTKAGYVIRDGKLFKLDAEFKEEEIKAVPKDALVDVYKNSLIYTTPGKIYVVNLETDEEEEISYEGKITGSKVEDGVYKINTQTKSISIEV